MVNEVGEMDSVSPDDHNNSGISVFEIDSPDYKLNFLSWILDITQEEADKGFEFLKRNNKSIEVLWDLLENLKVFTVVVEDHYVDRVYRDSYYFYYSGKHFSYTRFCKRLSIFDGKLEKNFFDYCSEELQQKFVGTIVIRPIPERSIGRTLLSPKYFLPIDKNGYVRLAKYVVTVFGKQLEVWAFPYGMQDGETTSCAEVTILNLLDYYSQSYPEYHYLLPSEISHLVEKSSFERRMPTTGLSYELISKVFCEAGFYPRLYSAKKMPKNKFRHILSYYIESGIPVAIGLKIAEENKHSIICIGHMQPEKIQLGQILNCANNSESDNVVWVSDTADLVDTYCFMDDNKRPYNISECVEVAKLNTSILSLDGFEVEYMMVPLYKRMILEAADAYDICMSVIASLKFGIKSFSQEWDSETKKQLLGSIDHELGTKEEPLVIRLFMASSRTFRKKRDTQFNVDNKEIQDYYNMTVFPKFVWVCEISSKALYENQQVLGEIIIDATSSPDAKMDSIIIVNYPYALCRRMPEDFLKASEACFEEVKEWKPYDIFRGNLTDCQSL